MVVGSVLDVRRGRRYENFFGIPVPIIPWASNFPTAYVRVASQTYVLQHILQWKYFDNALLIFQLIN